MLPLIIGDRVVGLVELDQSEYERDFTADEIRLCQAIANQAAVIIENTRLYEEAQRRAGELAILNKTGQAISSTLDLDEVLAQAMTEAKAIVDAESVSVLLRDLVRDELTFTTAVGPASESLVGTHMPTTEGIAGWVVQEGQPVLVRDVQSDSRFYDQIDTTTGLTTRSLLAVPLKYKDQVIGVIEVLNKTDGYFDEHDRDLLSALAGSAAVAIENARLYEETAHRLAETRVLQEVMRVATSTLDFDQILERTIETLQVMMQVELLGFALPDEEGEGLWLHPAQVGFPPLTESFRLPLNESVCGRVFQTGTPILTGDVREIPCYYEGAPEVCSELAVPVFAGGHVIGVLNVESRRPNDFDEEDMAFYTAIAGQLGVALENARLYQEVRRQADELAAAVARLRELDRLKSEFIQNVSHELRTPLALMRGYAEVLSMGELGELQPEQKEPVAIIARRARILTGLVGDITLIMEVETNPPRPEPVSWDELTRAAMEGLEITAAQTGLTLQTEIAPGLPPVYCTPTYLQRVLDNLIGNAIKFTPEGGTITVRLRQEDGQVTLEVSDTGVGIPTDRCERIFERFYQVDGSASRRYGGVGLGLALVKEIVEAYNGCVTVQSQAGKGSTFIVTLPISQEVGDTGVV
jgi:signal transduction histidine kinase